MLAVDIGNTFTRIAVFAGAEIVTRGSFHTNDMALELLRAVFAEAAESSATRRVWIASVVPAANALVDAAAERAGLTRRFIKPGADFILPHALKTPGTTGVDRLLSALAAGRLLFAEGLGMRGYATIQCGSAATVDYVDGEGSFRGGYIIPGPGMWMSGLRGGAMLPDLSGEIPDWESVAIGDNTHDAMTNGMHVALPIAVASAAMMIPPDGKPGRRNSLPVVVTGGWGEAVLPYVQSRTFFDKDLVLRGAKVFAERELESGAV